MLQLLHSFFNVSADDARKAMEAGQGKGSGEASHHRVHLDKAAYSSMLFFSLTKWHSSPSPKIKKSRFTTKLCRSSFHASAQILLWFILE
jgi:hypothetical protein